MSVASSIGGTIIGGAGLAIAIYDTWLKPKTNVYYLGPSCAGVWKMAGKYYPCKECIRDAWDAGSTTARGCDVAFACAAIRGNAYSADEVTFAYGYDTTGIKDVICGPGWQQRNG